MKTAIIPWVCSIPLLITQFNPIALATSVEERSYFAHKPSLISDFPGLFLADIRNQIYYLGGCDADYNLWTGCEEGAEKDCRYPNGGFIVLEELDMMGDEQPEYIAYYLSPPSRIHHSADPSHPYWLVYRWLNLSPIEDAHGFDSYPSNCYVFNAQGSYMYRIPYAFTQGDKVNGFFQGEEARDWEGKHTNPNTFTWIQWVLTDKCAHAVSYSGDETWDTKKLQYKQSPTSCAERVSWSPESGHPH